MRNYTHEKKKKKNCNIIGNKSRNTEFLCYDFICCSNIERVGGTCVGAVALTGMYLHHTTQAGLSAPGVLVYREAV